MDLERRFGGLERLYGATALDRLSHMHVIVAGIGGVGSWCAEALARSGIVNLSLIDLDHIAESNINRQVHALTSTLGKAKISAMQDRINDINPDCLVRAIDDFIEPTNTNEILEDALKYSSEKGLSTALIDCTDQVAAKISMLNCAKGLGLPILVCGGAGGKTDPFSLRHGDLAIATHDALLSKMRQILRKQFNYPKGDPKAKQARKRTPSMRVNCLWFEQTAVLPDLWQQQSVNTAPQGLSCAGYGSGVTITATMGLAAADWAIGLALK